MAQKTFVDGDVLSASDLNTYCAGEGGAWTSHTPQIDQGASTNIAKTVSYSKYARYGRMIVFNFTLTLTAAGTAGSNVTITIPVTAADVLGLSGVGYILDDSTATRYAGTWAGNTTTKIILVTDATGAAAWGTTPNLALASADVLRGSITYEAAT